MQYKETTTYLAKKQNIFSETETLSSHGHGHICTCVALLQDASGCAQEETLRAPIARQANGLVDLE